MVFIVEYTLIFTSSMYYTMSFTPNHNQHSLVITIVSMIKILSVLIHTDLHWFTMVLNIS